MSSLLVLKKGFSMGGVPSQNINKEYGKLRELLLIESCLPPEVKTYLDEQKVDTLQRAAIYSCR